MRLSYLTFTLLFTVPVSAQTTYWVNAACPDDGANGTTSVCTGANRARKTINGGIALANDNDTIKVVPGTYTGADNHNVAFVDPITLVCNGPPGSCIVDCGDTDCASPTDRAFKFVDTDMGHDEPATLEGFKMTNCYSSTYGGAIYVQGTQPTIRNCTFTDNCATYGGAIGVIKEAIVRLENCVFTDNSALYGGAIYASHTPYETDVSIWIDYCTIGRDGEGNEATSGGGGGLYLEGPGKITMKRSRIEGNISSGTGSAKEGAGMRITGNAGRAEIANCVFAKNAFLNTVDDGGGIAVIGLQTSQGGSEANRALLKLMNSIIVANSGNKGGGIYVGKTDGTVGGFAEVEFVNSILYGNTASATNGGHEMWFGPENVQEPASGSGARNAIIWKTASSGDSVEAVQGNLTIEESDVSDLSSLSGMTLSDNISSDPLFIDFNGADNILGTLDDNFRIQSTSPCKDTGDQTLRLEDYGDLDNDSNFTEATPRDLDVLNDRVIGSEIDMGSYEYDGCTTDAQCGDDSDPCNGDEKCQNGHCVVLLDDCNQNEIDDDCEVAAIGDWKSIVTHGTSNTIGLMIVSDPPFSEPRNGGVTKLRLSFSSPIKASSVSAANVIKCGKDVNGNAVDLSGITVTTIVLSGNTALDIDFSPKLPNYARYRVRLNGVEDMACHTITTNNERIFTSLFGDAYGDLRVNATDVGGVRSLEGTGPPIDPNAPNGIYQVRSDVDNDNDVDSTDTDFVRGEVGKDARFITDPTCP